jgi:hypothetical protein
VEKTVTGGQAKHPIKRDGTGGLPKVKELANRSGVLGWVVLSVSMIVRAADYTVKLEPDTAKRKVIAIGPAPVSATLSLTPELPWKIGSSQIAAQDTFLWWGPYGYTEGTSPQPYLHSYRMLNASSSREYIKITGKLVKDGSGSATPPWFRVTVPSVDIDWDEFKDADDEAGEDSRKPYCLVSSSMNGRRKLLIRNPLSRDDSDLTGMSSDMLITLGSGVANCFRLLRANGTVFMANTGTLSVNLNSVSTWPMELYVDAISGRPASDVVIDLEGPAGPDGQRARDRIQGTTAISLTLDDPIWWFDGADPGGGYHVQATLSATAPEGGQFVWRVVAGGGRVDLNNGGVDADEITAVDDNTVAVKSTGASSAIDDVIITLVHNGTMAGQYKLTVRKPGAPRLVSGYPTDIALSAGFRTRYLFQMLDQFGADVPFDMPINESFSAWTSDHPPVLWLLPSPNGMVTTSIIGYTHAFSDTYSIITGLPLPVGPNDPGANEKITHATQYYRAGSTAPGQGILFKQHTLQFYRGKARQE